MPNTEPKIKGLRAISLLWQDPCATLVGILFLENAKDDHAHTLNKSHHRRSILVEPHRLSITCWMRAWHKSHSCCGIRPGYAPPLSVFRIKRGTDEGA